MRKMMREVALDRVQLLPSMFKDRYDLNRAYLMSLKTKTCSRTIIWKRVCGCRRKGQRISTGAGSRPPASCGDTS